MPGLRMWFREFLRSKEDPAPNPSLPRIPSEPESFAQGNNDFALAMYGQLRQRPGNLFFSPFSIRTALCMALVGARGETAAQMREALRISSSGETLHVAFEEILQRLKPGGGREYEVAAANSLWCQDGAMPLPEFVDLIARYYGGGMNLVDFRVGVEAARAAINQWVEDNTRGKIQDLIPVGGLDADTRLVMVNAVYFKGTWVLQFRKTNTRDEPFDLEEGGKVRVPLMYQQTERVRYMQTSGYQAVELIYVGGDLSMLVLLPNRKDGLRDLEKKLSARMLHECVAEMEVRKVKLYLPRFKITWGTAEMSQYLTTLGMTLPFARLQADFSGINGYKPPAEESLFLAAVFHKAFVDVYEEGTEAAAATGGVVLMGSSLWPSKPPPVPIFRADHPFLFAIRDRKSDTILFLGRITDPSREK